MKTNIVNFYLVLLVATNVAARSFCQSTSSLPSLWTLEACVDYARNNNLAVRQAEVSRQEAEVSVVQSEAAYWPTLSFSAGANYTNQPYGSPVNAFSTNAGLNFNWRIYDGSRRLTVEQNRIAGREAALKVEQTANTVEEQVMLLYVQAVYSHEAISVSKASVETSEQVLQQGQAKFDVGKLSASELAQLTAQKASDEYGLVSAQTQYENYLLQLRQQLELPADYRMTLSEEAYTDEQVLRPIPQLESIYSQAVAHRPEIRSAELEIENARHGLGIARSGYYPTLSLSAGTGVGFRTGSDYTFAEQMKNSWSNTAGLSLNVPILQGRQTRSNVEKAQLRQSMAQLSRESALKDLRRTIETTWLNARNAQQQFIAARAEQQAAQAGYELTQEQFRVGRATATDLLNQHTQLLSAQQRTLQAKYMAVYYAGLLQHYAQ